MRPMLAPAAALLLHGQDSNTAHGGRPTNGALAYTPDLKTAQGPLRPSEPMPAYSAKRPASPPSSDFAGLAAPAREGHGSVYRLSNGASMAGPPGMSEEDARKAGEPISSDISLDNLVAGSRRKRNKFCDDLPLLPFPHGHDDAGSHFGASVLARMPLEQNGHANGHGHGRSYSMSQVPTRPGSGVAYGHATGHSHGHGHTPSFASLPGRVSFPTPAPTTISDEDVAMQLIRLGDPSLSPFKCPSEKSSSPVPALQTALQLKAMHDGIAPEQALLQHQQQQQLLQQKREMPYPSSPPASLNEQQQHESNRSRAGSGGVPMHTGLASAGLPFELAPPTSVRSRGHRASSVTSDQTVKEDLEPGSDDVDIPRPQNLPPFHTHFHGTHDAGGDHDDTGAGRPPKQDGRSIGIRCTRCKKSKKGCDRQRPCGRCADAGEDCVTEDEGSGRGRSHRGNGRKKRA